MNHPTIIQFPEYEDLFNSHFIQLVDDTSRIIILYGGRGSSKSSFAAAAKVILPILRESYFKAVCIRKSYNTISASCYQQWQSDSFQRVGRANKTEINQRPDNDMVGGRYTG